MMPGFFKCPHCPRAVPTCQGLKSHITRIHKDRSGPNLNSGDVFSSRLNLDGAEEAEADIPSTGAPGGPGSSSASLIALRLSKLKSGSRYIKRIPKGARPAVGEALISTINACLVDTDSEDGWERLLFFTSGCLRIPVAKDERKVSLASHVKAATASYMQGLLSDLPVPASTASRSGTRNNEYLARGVESKLSDGDISGAVRLLCSEESFAPQGPETLRELHRLHPKQLDTFVSPELPNDDDPVLVASEAHIRGAILSFPPGSAGGLDHLTPQHLKDLINVPANNVGTRLVSAITKLCNFMLRGRVPSRIRVVLFGASMCALLKKSGGVRPIAVGCTWRRLVAKICCLHIRSIPCAALRPPQMGFGVPRGCEAAAHAARRYFQHQHVDQKVFLKIDFCNAFNTVNRDNLLRSVKEHTPLIYSFVHQCYRYPSSLVFGEDILSSERGIQQGDPLGPALFCLIASPLVTSVRSELNIWYLDDAGIGGNPETVLSDLARISRNASSLGLDINPGKCELFFPSVPEEDRAAILRSFQAIAPDILTPEDSKCWMLGVPLVEAAIRECLLAKSETLRRMAPRLELVKAHAAYFLLRHSLAIPKLTFVLRSSPTWRCNDGLRDFDKSLRSTFEKIINVCLDEKAWVQASLPIAVGGLGVRRVEPLALSAFLSSSYGSETLVSDLLPAEIYASGDLCMVESCALWSVMSGGAPPPTDLKHSQKAWDDPLVASSRRILSELAVSPLAKARLLGVSAKESGAFLNVLPSAPLGTVLNNEDFRIAISLRLGAKVCEPHVCSCGASVDEYGLHGLNCVKSAGRRVRHATINDIIRRSMVSANIPAVLEPPHLSADDNSRPDGLSLVPWSGGKPLAWDFTCTNGLAPSHLEMASEIPLYAASVAESNKCSKYAHLLPSFVFAPVAVECLGAFGPRSVKTIRDLGRRLTAASGEKRATEYLFQRISVAVQRGNAISVRGSLPTASSLDDFLEQL